MADNRETQTERTRFYKKQRTLQIWLKDVHLQISRSSTVPNVTNTAESHSGCWTAHFQVAHRPRGNRPCLVRPAALVLTSERELSRLKISSSPQIHQRTDVTGQLCRPPPPAPNRPGAPGELQLVRNERRGRSQQLTCHVQPSAENHKSRQRAKTSVRRPSEHRHRTRTGQRLGNDRSEL